MQRYTLTILVGLILVFLSGCKKDTTGINNYTAIVGTWELKQEQGGMMPSIEYSQGNGNILKFSTYTYEKYTNNNLVRSGQYILIEDTSVGAEVGLVIPPGQFTHRIVYDNDFTAPKTFVQISNNKLSTLSGYFPLDGGSNVIYQKIESIR
jgi:hypothetical protein